MFGNVLADLAVAPFEALVFALIATAAGVYNGFVGLRRVRLIEDAPTALIRSAHQGYVELNGTAAVLPGPPVIAHLSQTPCCWYSYKIEKQRDKGWSTVASGSSDDLFVLRDATGECVIDPEGAKVHTLHKQTWYGGRQPDGRSRPYPKHPLLRDAADKFGTWRLLGRHVQIGVGNYRYSERVLLEGDPLYAIGWFRSSDHSDRARAVEDLRGQILREWKTQPEQLARFDANQDGEIDAYEWEQARRAARAQAAEQWAEQAAKPATHMLSKPANRPYLLANKPEAELIRAFKWRMRLGFTAFVLGGGAASVMLSARFLH